jgi:hypothetical protein
MKKKMGWFQGWFLAREFVYGAPTYGNTLTPQLASANR